LRLERLEDRRLLTLSIPGTELPVGASSTGDQQTFPQSPAPTAAVDPEGNSTLVWASDGEDGSDWGVFGQRFDRHGSVRGEPFSANTTVARDQTFPSVAAGPDGQFVVTWSGYLQDSSGYGVYARLFDAQGQPEGDEFQVNSYTAGNQNFSAVAMDAHGRFVITWTSQAQDGDGAGIYGQRFDADGARLGEEFRVNDVTSGSQRYSCVAVDESGNFIVTWTATDDSGSGIFARRFTADGTAVGAEFSVNTTTAGTQQLASVAARGDVVMAAWQGYDSKQATWNVYCRRLDFAGTAHGDEILVGPGRYASVDVGLGGDFAVARQTYDPQRVLPVGLVVEHFDLLGNLSGDPWRYYGTSEYDRESPSLAMSADRLTVQWMDDGPNRTAVQARLFEVSGNGRIDVVVDPIADDPVDEGQIIEFQAAGYDPDDRAAGPLAGLTFRLGPNAPEEAEIDSATGRFTWQPTEAQGPGEHGVLIVAVDNRTPPRIGLATFAITVAEVNRPPAVESIELPIVREEQKFTWTPTVIDADLPANEFTYGLEGEPDGMSVDSQTGQIEWTPTEQQGPEDYGVVTLTVVDNGTPPQRTAAEIPLIVEEVNRAPTVWRIENRAVDDGRRLQFPVTATDPDVTPDGTPNALTFSLAPGAPPGAWINPATGTFTWTPRGQQGTYEVVVRVEDDGTPPLSHQRAFSIRVEPSMLRSIADHSVGELEELSLTAVAEHPDDPHAEVTYGLTAGTPEGMTIDRVSGELTWTPTERQGPRTYTITVKAAAGEDPTLIDTTSFQVTVETVLVLEEVEPVSVDEGATVSLTLLTTEPAAESGSLIYALGPDAPEGAEIDRTTGAFTFTPDESQGPQEHRITVTVTDAGNPACVGSTTLVIDVAEVNQAPVIEEICDRYFDAGQIVRCSVIAADTDEPANGLTFGLGVGAPQGAAIDPATGLFTWEPSAEQGPGTYEVPIWVADDGTPALESTTSFSVSIVTPMFDDVADRTVKEGNTLVVPLPASHPSRSDATLTFSLDPGAPDGAEVEPVAGYFLWTPTEAQGPGEYDVVVRVADDGEPAQSDVERFTVTVDEVNRAPVLKQVADQTVEEGEEFSLVVKAVDPDRPAGGLSFALGSGAPDGAKINADTGRFTWTPTAEHGPATHEITVIVSDDGTPQRSDTMSFSIDVTASILEPIPDQTIVEGTLLSLMAVATHPDAPEAVFTFSLDDGKPEGMQIDANGQITWEPTEQQGPGTYAVVVRATYEEELGVEEPAADESALEDTIRFSIEVAEENQPPTLAELVDSIAGPGATVVLQAVADDEDYPTDELYFELTPGKPGVELPEGARIDPKSGRFRWALGDDVDYGTHAFTITVRDDAETPLSASQDFNVKIEAPNAAPTIDGAANQAVDENVEFELQLTASDPDDGADSDGADPDGALVFELRSDAPEGAVIDPGSGLFTWTPNEAQGPGEYVVTVGVTDAGTPALSDATFLTIVVREVNRGPEIDDILPQTVDGGTTLRFTATATDPDLPPDAFRFALGSGAPGGAVIIPTTGQFIWTPDVGRGPETHTFDVVAFDTDAPEVLRSATEVTVHVEPQMLDPIDPQTVDEGRTLRLRAFAAGPYAEQEGLAFSLHPAEPGGSVPAGVQIDAATGQLTFTPTETQGPGTHSLVVRVTDSDAPAFFDNEPLVVVVREVNLAPALKHIEGRSVRRDETISLTARASDADLQLDGLPLNKLTYSLAADKPPGAAIDPDTGVFAWTPDQATAVGNYDVTIRVSDNGSPGLTDTATFSITVEEANNTPTVANSIEDVTVLEGAADDAIDLSTVFEDVDVSDTLEFSVIENTAAGLVDASVDGTTLTLRCLADQNGSAEITIRATDSQGASVEDSFTVNVTAVNDAPTFLPGADQTVLEDDGPQSVAGWAAAISAGPADETGQTLKFNVTGNTNEALFAAGPAIDAETGELTYTPAANVSGSADVTITLSDDGGTDDGGNNTSAPQTFRILVEDDAPRPHAIAPLDVPAGTLLSLTVTAEDPNSDRLTYSLADGAPTGAWIFSNTGRFFWRPTTAQTGQTEITIRVTEVNPFDGANAQTGETTFTVNVLEGNEAPVLDPVAPVSAIEGKEFSLPLKAADPDGQDADLRFSLHPLEPGASVPEGAAIDATTGRFTWTPAEQHGPATHFINVRVTDAGSPPQSDTVTLPIYVAEANRPPEILTAVDGVLATTEGQMLSLQIDAVDPDRPAAANRPINTLSYRLDPGAPIGAAIDLATGLFTFTPDERQGSESYDVTVRVSDNGQPALEDTLAFSIDVAEDNRAPVLEPIADRTVDDGALLSLRAVAHDADLPANRLTYTLGEGAPKGTLLFKPSGWFIWRPSDHVAPGDYEITTHVTDDGSPPRTDTRSFTVTLNGPEPDVASATWTRAVDQIHTLFGASAAEHRGRRPLGRPTTASPSIVDWRLFDG